MSCVGATTKEEYERFFKKDAALNRRFEKIDVKEPTKEETFELIKVAKKSYEKFHQAKNMENKLMDPEFQESPQHAKFQKAYSKIIEKWGKSLENKVFPVDIDVVYDIFAYKLNTSKENVRENNNIPLSGKIGF